MTEFSGIPGYNPDLVLIYQKPDDTVLQLVRLGSHSELGL
jgi:mRNA interferase YafQ